MPAPDQPFRQVHLDFHTGHGIPDVAADFDPAAFAETLTRARVNSIQLFARDWHGWAYYPTKFADRVHPNLTRPDLLGEQIKACHDAGVRCPIYTAVQVDRRSADLNPDWCQRQPDLRAGGEMRRQGVFDAGWEPLVCLGSPFRDFFREHLAELLARYDCDGFWFDGVSPQECVCRHCLAGMKDRGVDPSDREARRAYGMQVCHDWLEETTAQVRAAHPDATVFHNAGHVGPRHRRVMDDHTHLELESLPGGGWGYLHFPTVARYARTLTDQVVGMTGKFHRGWGEFHAFKNQAALEFECFQMLAHGSRVSVGDQLHPRGTLDPATYDLIGRVFEQVEAVEPHVAGATPVAEAAVVTSEGLLMESWDTMLPSSLLGATRMLQELGVQFDIVDGLGDLSKYGLLVLPDDAPDTPAVRAFIKAGGATIVTGDSLVGDDGVLEVGGTRVELEADRPAADFVVPMGPFADDLPRTEHVVEPGGRRIVTHTGQPLATLRRPYHPRTWDRFCSHLHAPSDGVDLSSAAVRCGKVVYFTHKLFTSYRETAPRWCKSLVAAAIDQVHDRVLTHTGPSTLLAHLHRTDAGHVLHLLNYVPERRGRSLDVIEEPQTVTDLSITLGVSVGSARALRGGDVTLDGGTLRLDRLHGYEVIVLDD